MRKRAGAKGSNVLSNLPVVKHTANGKITVMNATVDQVVADALSFPPAMRAFVAEKLIESLDMPESLPCLQNGGLLLSWPYCGIKRPHIRRIDNAANHTHQRLEEYG